MYIDCMDTERVPMIWLKANVIALLKPGKAGNDASDF